MSLVLDNPVIETHDVNDQFDAWRIDGLTDNNSRRGRLYPNSAPDVAGVKLSVFSDLARTILVAEGVGAINGRVTATPQNNSQLTVSAFVRSATVTSEVVLYGALATEDDFRGRDDRINNFLNEDPPEVDFAEIRTLVMRDFLLRVQEKFPPPIGLRDPLTFPRSSGIQEAGRMGLPEINAIHLWRLNSEDDWEIVGLQNVSDFREWAIQRSLGEIWERKGRSGNDNKLARADRYFARARELFRRTPIMVDVNRDGQPERIIKTHTMRMKRG